MINYLTEFTSKEKLYIEEQLKKMDFSSDNEAIHIGCISFIASYKNDVYSIQRITNLL